VRHGEHDGASANGTQAAQALLWQWLP